MRRLIGAPGRLVAWIRRRLVGLWEPIRPERGADGKLTSEGNREGVVLYGLALLAGCFAVAGFWPLALGIPGVLLVAIGLGFDLRRTR